MSYNGWENYETWLTFIYLNGFVYLNGYEDWQNFVETNLLVGEKDEEITEDKKIEKLAEYLKDCIAKEADMAGLTGFLKDLVANAISEIDFTELAYVFLED